MIVTVLSFTAAVFALRKKGTASIYNNLFPDQNQFISFLSEYFFRLLAIFFLILFFSFFHALGCST